MIDLMPHSLENRCMILKNLDLVNLLFSFRNKWCRWWFLKKRIRHDQRPQFGNPCEFFWRLYSTAIFLDWTIEPKQTHEVPENTKQVNLVMARLGANQHSWSANWHLVSANRHLRNVDRYSLSADWHFRVPTSIHNFAPTPRIFLMHFLCFLKNIFSVRDYETLS